MGTQCAFSTASSFSVMLQTRLEDCRGWDAGLGGDSKFFQLFGRSSWGKVQLENAGVIAYFSTVHQYGVAHTCLSHTVGSARYVEIVIQPWQDFLWSTNRSSVTINIFAQKAVPSITGYDRTSQSRCFMVYPIIVTRSKSEQYVTVIRVARVSKLNETYDGIRM